MADPKLRKLRDPATARYLENIVNSTKEILKLESGGMQMIPDKVYVEPEQLDAASYNKTKVGGRTWKTPMYADISLKDSNTGKLIQKKEKMLIGYIPDITPVGSFLIQGSEYYVPTQFRIKPGVYTRERNDGLLESWFNTAKGRSMKILFDSDKEDFKINIAGKTIPLFPILQATAKSENQLRGWFGDRLAIKLAKKYKSNAKKISALNKMNIAITGEEQTDPVIAAENIKKYWEDRPGALDPASVKESLGVDADRVSPEIIGKSVSHILKVFKGEDEVDDRDNLAFKQALTYENLIPMRLSNPSIVRNIQYKIKYRLAKKGNIRESIPVGVITQPITDFFLVNGGSLAVSSDQTNVLSMYNTTKKSTILGEGSISSTDAIVAGARDLHPTKMGIIDPVFTPESDKVGVVEHLARGVVYDHKNNVLKTKVWDRKENKEVLVEPSRALNDGMAIRDQFVKKNGKFSPKDKLIWGYIGGDIGRTAEEKIRYIFHKPENMFSQTTNMVPFLTSNSGPRLMMASKMMEQAVPLIREERESPLVEAVTEEGKSFADEIIYPKDREALVSISPGDGIVENVSENFISVKTKKGVEKVSTYKNHPLTAKTFLSSEPIVKKGQKVKKGELLADINFTKDGKLAIGKNLTVAYMPYMGYTLDDGIVISEAAAKKLTSEHLYKITIPIDRNTILSKDKFRSAFPGIIEDKESKKYDEDGIIREGQTIDEADQISLTVRKLTPGPVSDIYTRLRKRKDSFIDSSISWDRPMSGKVVKINKTPNSVEVHVKTTESMEVGDKLTGRFGNKGVISAIIPDKDMPRKKDGSVVDVIFDPVSVPGRANPGQIFEIAAGKIAQHDGRVYQVYNFEEGKNHHKKLTEELRDRGISDKEELFGPDGKSLGSIALGPQYILKLQHRVASKMSARERAGYDVDQNPLHGGTEVGKAKGVDRMILYSLLASGARANLQEMSILKGTRNEEYWRALESGDPLPSLKVPFAMEKMMSYLKAAGINVSKEGSSLKLLPMTDKDILSISAGKISLPRMIRAKDLKEEPGGLFDPVITGGLEGKRYSHMTLPEPMPNPIFEKAIASVLNIREKDVGEIISGRSGIDKNGNITKDPNENEIGGKAIHMALNSLNVKKELKSTKERLDEIDINEQPDLVNKLNRRARYLRNLSELNIPPSNAYIMNHIPVIPPVFRPVYPLPSGDLETADLNYLYRDIGIMSIQLEKAASLTRSDRSSVRSGLYDAIKAYSGITSPKYGRPFKGVVEYIAGKGSPKSGAFQRKVLRKEQDISGRSVITPNPELGPDEVELPKEMAWKLYRPLTIRSLVVNQGLDPDEASEEVELKTPRAARALDITMSKHPVFLNRAPTLHKFSIMAFRPKMWSGKTIRMPHLVAKGFSVAEDSVSMTKIDGEIRPYYIKEIHELFHSGKEIEVLASKDMESGWRKLTNVLQFPAHEKLYKIKTKGNMSVEASGNHSFIVCDGGKYVKKKASDISEGDLIPFIKSIPTDKKIKHIDLMDWMPRYPYNLRTKMSKGFHLNKNTGWLLGMYYAEGSVITSTKGKGQTISFASANQEMLKKLKDLFESEFKMKTRLQVCKRYGYSAVLVDCSPLSRWFLNYFGNGSHNKIVPSFMFSADEETRLGFLAGTLDGDGTYNGRASIITTVSKRGAISLTYLFRSLNIYPTIQMSKKIYYNLHMYGNIDKINKLKFYKVPKFSKNKIIQSMSAFIPISDSELSLSKQKAKNHKIILSDKSCYNLKKLTPDKALELSNKLGDTKFSNIIRCRSNKNVYSSPVKKIEQVDYKGKHIYDLCVEDFHTFEVNMSICHNSADYDGDEMSVFVPITPKAAKEASSLMPTANLFNPGSMDIMLAPAQSTLHGLYHATTPSGPFKGSFDTSLDVQSSVDSGAISINDRINFKGQKTTPGSVLINERLPKNLQNYQAPLNINRVKEILRDLADKNTSDYGRVVSEMKTLGDQWATGSGLTIGMDDIAPIYEKNKIIDSAISKSKNSAAAIDQRASVDRELKGVLNRIKSESSIIKMLNSGAISKGKYSQIKQILMSPVMAQNYRRTPIPVLIKSSYSEGLSPTEYWAASFGARAGMMDRALSTSLPGAFAKEVLAASVSLTITINDCRTSKGKNISVSDPFASGRLLAKSAGEFPANTIVDGNILRNLKSQNIKYIVVRSPSTCEAKKGICQKCYGLSESGSYYEIGENIGSISGTSITEPITQMAMTGFHTSGVVEGGGGVLTGSPRIFQLLRLPTFVAGAAVLSRKSGKVDSVSETEAGRVKIDISGSPHFVQPGIALKVKKGDRISKGQPITGGLVNPRDIIITKGIEAFRGFLSDELRKTYKEQNKDIDPRHFDVISRIVSSHARIDEPGSSDFIKGDIAPIDEIELLNKDIKNKIEYEPYLRGVNTAPLASSDWLARMGYQQIRKTIQEGAASGWSSEVGEMGHPIASYVFGTEFFKGDSPALKRLNNAWVDLKSV